MKNHLLAAASLLLVICASELFAFDYPGMAPGEAVQTIAEDQLILENAVIRGEWKLDAGRITSLSVKNHHCDQTLTIGTSCLPRVILSHGRVIDLASLRATKPLHLDDHAATATFEDKGSGLVIKWSATLNINSNGFSMGGAKYQKAFRDVCLKMMRDNGVSFFKFDGMGGGRETIGAKAGFADDIDAVLDLSRLLHRENPEVFISATVGTWASPFWTLYADSIWRQGEDNGLFGQGDTRQQWITYRDKHCYERIVQLGPLYPLNSLMLGGIIIGDHRSPARLVRNEKSIADETWSFFGSGTNLQELYVTPKLPSETTWDVIAAAAKWSRANSDVLLDTHWIGGNPAKAEIYGWASWRPGKGILTLRNPSDQPQSFSTTLQAALELPDGVKDTMTAKVHYPQGRKLPADISKQKLQTQQSISLTLQPFEVIVIELQNSP